MGYSFHGNSPDEMYGHIFYVREPYRRAYNRVNGTPERNSVRLHQMTPLCLSPRAQINQVAVGKWSRDQTCPHSRFPFILCQPRPSPRPLGNGLVCQGALGVRGLDARLPRRRVPRRHLQQQRRVPPPPPIPVTRGFPKAAALLPRGVGRKGGGLQLGTRMRPFSSSRPLPTTSVDFNPPPPLSPLPVT